MKLNNTIVLLTLFLASFTSVKATAQGLTDQVYIDKVAYCRVFRPLCNDTNNSDYHWWKDNGVPDQAQKQTYIGKYNIPAPRFVKNIVFITSGQRGVGFGSDNFKTNLLTGQQLLFPFGAQDRGRWQFISQRSLAYQMFDREIYSLDDTFSALAFDARFNQNFTSSNKEKIVNAYYDWLKSKAADMSQVESVYLGGHSRGGSLVLRLAQKFTNDFPGLKVIVHAFDPVPNRTQNELGVNVIGGTTNPLNDDYFVSNTRFEKQFKNTRNLSIYNFLSGDALALGIRGVGQADTDGQVIFELENWYTQQWFDIGHQGIANRASVVNLALDDLRRELTRTPLKGAAAVFNLMLSD